MPESIVYATYLRYRVICSQNPEHPEKMYVDICRDGFCSHDYMFELQKKKYNDEKLERVFNDSRGIMLEERRADGAVTLKYTRHRDPMAQKAQKEKRAIIDPIILRVFKRMKEEGEFLTFSMPAVMYAEERGEIVKRDGVQCLQDEMALAETLRNERMKKLKKIRQEFYAKKKYAAAPHLRLMLKQAERSGD